MMIEKVSSQLELLALRLILLEGSLNTLLYLSLFRLIDAEILETPELCLVDVAQGALQQEHS